ncbi:electron transport complex subunit RsxE, partial [Candidatus Hydrogenedentota bacterium]
LLGSNTVISLLRNVIPSKIRIPAFIVVIATFVTVVDMLLEAYNPEMHAKLGIFIPLIVVNCIILGRAEAFASQHKVLSSILDAIGMGVGFTLTLITVGAIRETLGAGTIFGYPLMELGTGGRFDPALIMIMAPGAFITLGLLMALMNWIGNRPAGGVE